MIKIVLRVLALLLIGFVCAVIGFIVVVNLGFMIAPDFSYNGREGYEATGPIGIILGALIGLIGSGILLFGKRTEKCLLTSSLSRLPNYTKSDAAARQDLHESKT